MGPAGGGINIVYASASNPCSSGDQAQRAGKPGYQRQSQGRADWMAGQPADQFRHRDGAAHLTSKGMLIGRGGRAAAFPPVTDSTLGACQGNANAFARKRRYEDRKSAVEGKGGSVSVNLGGPQSIKKKTKLS